MSSFSISQQQAMALTPKITSALSIPGSLFIIYETWCDHRAKKGSSVMQRALVGMSCVDILSSMGWFLSSWAAPEESLFAYAAGNRATCQFQGVLLQIAIGAPLYNGALILYFVLVIKYQYNNNQLLVLERVLHVLIWLWCLGTSFIVLGLDLIHFVGPVCWIGDPDECFQEQVPEGVPCGVAKKYSTAFFCVPLWIVICATICGLMTIYWEVNKTSSRITRRYSIGGRDINERRKSGNDVKKVAMRAALYSIAFCVTWTASTIWSVAQWFDYYPFWSSYLWTLFEPLQGCWNLLIFLYNRPSSREKMKQAIRAITCNNVLLFRPKSSTADDAKLSGASSSAATAMDITTSFKKPKRPLLTKSQLGSVVEDDDDSSFFDPKIASNEPSGEEAAVIVSNDVVSTTATTAQAAVSDSPISTAKGRDVVSDQGAIDI